MTKSRTAPRLLAALVASAAAAPIPALPVDPDRLVAARQAELRETMRLDCPPAADEEEIVVCGARETDRSYRIDPAFRTAPGSERAGQAQRDALAIDSSRCTTVGPNQQCTRGLDVIGIGFMVARAVVQAIANQD